MLNLLNCDVNTYIFRVRPALARDRGHARGLGRSCRARFRIIKACSLFFLPPIDLAGSFSCFHSVEGVRCLPVLARVPTSLLFRRRAHARVFSRRSFCRVSLSVADPVCCGGAWRGYADPCCSGAWSSGWTRLLGARGRRARLLALRLPRMAWARRRCLRARCPKMMIFERPLPRRRAPRADVHVPSCRCGSGPRFRRVPVYLRHLRPTKQGLVRWQRGPRSRPYGRIA